MPQAVKLSLSQFAHVLNALVLGQHISRHQITAHSNLQYHQLPYELSRAMKRLDDSLHLSSVNKILNSHYEFENFIKQLTTFAIEYHGSKANTENQQAAYLAGFLVHHQIEVEINNHSYSVRDLILTQLPDYIQYYLVTGQYHQIHEPFIPHGGYAFLNQDWLNNRNYPSLTELNVRWTQEKARLDQQAQYKAQLKQWEHQQHLAFRAQHHFDGMVLNLNQLSYALEAFIKSDIVRLANQNHLWQFKPQLSQKISDLMTKFAQLARTTNVWAPSRTEELNHVFVLLMKEIITDAKYNNQPASKLLLGFLLHHNFHLNVANQTFNMGDIFWAEATPQEKQLLQLQPGKASTQMPYVYQEWQQRQGYPGKAQMEKLLSNAPQVTSAPANHFLPSFSQQLRTQLANTQATTNNPFKAPYLPTRMTF
ncbi:hypothetical protein [Candidatus Berkiella aquae]|uniref:Uncharacterized protein n=1 Tax=Candidatus Berkiella aquae TaxID=295108 RepID=A0A0Q9YIV1_9GAMM|nr:hypothetical protein [Candidatus Berkiella aquae]MCS5712183.1 hypothetical protein [Candidatus Berkiella aquae]